LLLIRFWILWLGASGEHRRLHGVITWSPLPSLILIGCVCLQWLGCVERFWLTIREWLTVCELENGGKWSFTDGLSNMLTHWFAITILVYQRVDVCENVCSVHQSAARHS
jgi:hypothetical protein